jgi:hypothetical protein
MNTNFQTIDPNKSNLSDLAVIEKVMSEEDRLPEEEHKKAANASLLVDSVADGIAKDFAFVKKIPQYIKQIIEGKLWECLYVAKGVVTPYYCRYTKGTDSENFRAFITAKRPNGLETTIDEIDNILNQDPEVQWQFRTLFYESRQGERTDLVDEELTSRSDCGKLENLSSRQQENIRAANRAAEAIPIIRELLDRGLISIDVTAKLGRDIKDPDNLTAEEREYVENRDLIGLRINEYINTNIIPEDEYKEPAYSRELNRYIKDLLGIKDRSKSVRMDNPKKAADKLLQFYEGEKLEVLIDLLQQGLEPTSKELKALPEAKETEEKVEDEEVIDTSINHSSNGTSNSQISQITSTQDSESQSETNHQKADATQTEVSYDWKAHQESDGTVIEQQELTIDELAKRLQRNSGTVKNIFYSKRDYFPEWTQQRDPNKLAWKGVRKGDTWLFVTATNSNE